MSPVFIHDGGVEKNLSFPQKESIGKGRKGVGVCGMGKEVCGK